MKRGTGEVITIKQALSRVITISVPFFRRLLGRLESRPRKVVFHQCDFIVGKPNRYNSTRAYKRLLMSRHFT